MPISLSHFGFASEEIFLLCSICVVLLVDLFLSDRNRVITYALSILALTGAAVITVIGAVDADTIVLGGHYQADRLGDILKLCTYLVVAVVFLYSRLSSVREVAVDIAVTELSMPVIRAPVSPEMYSAIPPAPHPRSST